MTYAQYLENELKLRPEVTAYIAPVVGLINGAGPDAVSAFAASQIGMPGVARVRSRTGPLPQSFPGGNSTFARHFVKYLIPDAISGAPGLDGVHNGRLDFSALDRKDQKTRIRLGATVVRVEHAHSTADGDHVAVAYELGGKVYRTKARAVVMAAGGAMARAVLADMPADLRLAYAILPARARARRQRRAEQLDVSAHARRAMRAVVRRRLRVLVQYPATDGHRCRARADAPVRSDGAHLLHGPLRARQDDGGAGGERAEASARDELRRLRAADSPAHDAALRERRLRRAARHRGHHPQSLGPRARRAAAGFLLRHERPAGRARGRRERLRPHRDRPLRARRTPERDRRDGARPARGIAGDRYGVGGPDQEWKRS